MILAGKRLLITGVITKDSIAFHAAEQAQKEGATVLLTSFGRVRRMTERAAQRLPEAVDVLELDVNSPQSLGADRRTAGKVGRRRWRPARDRLRAGRRARRTIHDRSRGERDAGLPDERLLAQGPSCRAGATDAARERASSGSTSTRPWHGRSTTGWESQRRHSSRFPGTWLGTSGRRDPRQLGRRPDRWVPSLRAASQASRRWPSCGRSRRRWAGTSRTRSPVASTVSLPPVRLCEGDQRGDPARRWGLSRDRRTGRPRRVIRDAP